MSKQSLGCRHGSFVVVFVCTEVIYGVLPWAETLGSFSLHICTPTFLLFPPRGVGFYFDAHGRPSSSPTPFSSFSLISVTLTFRRRCSTAPIQHKLDTRARWAGSELSSRCCCCCCCACVPMSALEARPMRAIFKAPPIRAAPWCRRAVLRPSGGRETALRWRWGYEGPLKGATRSSFVVMLTSATCLG